MGFIDFTNGEVLTADQMDTVMRQGIMRFADASARDTALSAVLAEGMMAYLDDTDEVLKYDGTDWIDISGDITGVTAGTALTGGGTSGNVTLDVDESALTIAQSQVTDLVSDLADKQDDVITTQGDLVIGDASGDPVRLPVGSADQVLTSDGTTMTWEDAGGGGGWELLSTTSLTGVVVTVSGINQSYRNLRIEVIDVELDAVATYRAEFLNSSSNIIFEGTQSSGSTGKDLERLDTTQYRPNNGGTDLDTGESSNMFIEIFNYSSTSQNKSLFIQGNTGSEGVPVGFFAFATLRTDSAVNEFTTRALSSNFSAGQIKIYGSN